MAHRLRHIEPGRLYELVRRCLYGRYRFRPTPSMVAELRGIIAEAQHRWPQVLVHQWHFLSSHFHAILSATGPHATNAVVSWINYVMSQTARVAQAFANTRGPIWERKRCRLTPILDDEMLRARTKYIMAQATAAGLVARPNQWPGLNTCDALCRGARLIGYLGSAALRRQAEHNKVSMVTIAPRREMTLAPLPMHADWPAHQRQRWYREIEREIIEETAADNPGGRYPPPEYYGTVDPHEEHGMDDSAAPQCYASEGNHEARRTWRTMIREFTDAWREALGAWVNGARACFPPCGWVPFGACFAPSYPRRE